MKRSLTEIVMHGISCAAQSAQAIAGYGKRYIPDSEITVFMTAELLSKVVAEATPHVTIDKEDNLVRIGRMPVLRCDGKGLRWWISVDSVEIVENQL